MALTAVLYRFRIDLSDVDRGIYEALDLRVAMHPSEALPYLMTRVVAYALNWEEGLEFAGAGLSATDEPAISSRDQNGAILLWIEIGNPSARKLHKAGKQAKRVCVYTYRDPKLLITEIQGEKVHRAEELELYALDLRFLEGAAELLKRDNHWTMLRNDGQLVISAGDLSASGEIRQVFSHSDKQG